MYQYSYLAYQREDGPTWFVGSRSERGRIADDGIDYIHYIRSSVQRNRIIPKYDKEVFGIDQPEYRRLTDLEQKVSQDDIDVYTI